MASTPVIKIVIHGDDQSQGMVFDQFGRAITIAPNESSALQTLLQKQFNDSGITVQNASSGGRSSSLANELDGMDGMGAGQPQRMQASGAQIAVEAHSINDAFGGESVGQYAAYLGQWVQDAQDNGIQPVLGEPTPVCDGNHPQLGAYAQAIDDAAKQHGVPVIHHYNTIAALTDWQAHTLGCLIPDATLDAVKAQQAEAIISPLVAKLIGV
jgi:hypothetical protein